MSPDAPISDHRFPAGRLRRVRPVDGPAHLLRRCADQPDEIGAV